MSRLVEMAIAAQNDAAAVAILWDIMLEDGWDDVRIMMLVFGIKLDPLRPQHRTAAQNAYWDKQREDDIARPQAAAPQYAGRRRDWARAVLAVLLFASWPPRRKKAVTDYRTRSPWPLVVAQYRQRQKDNDASANGQR